MLIVQILEGNARKITATFRVPGVGDPLDDVSTWDVTDPTTITFTRKRLKQPATSIETWTYAAAQITKESTGVYSKVLDFDSNGSWAIGAKGTGACKAYDEVVIVVSDAEALT